MTVSHRVVGQLSAAGRRFAVVAARFNDFVTQRLVGAAVDTIERHGGDTASITEVWVPGSWELPLICRRLAASGKFHAVIALGCVIRGQTPHFEYVAGEAARGIARASLETNVPIAFGVITADTLEQAIERAGSKAGNKGADAARTAIEMADLVSRLNEHGK
jgi:6,7-dimethyl-8-ribityllumazine synthase